MSSRRPTASKQSPSGSTGDRRPGTWLWFRLAVDARSPAEEEFKSLPVAGRAGLAKLVERFLAGESRYKDVSSLGDGLLELRYRQGNDHYRVLFFRHGANYVALTAFYKNQQRTPKADVDRARQRARRWIEVYGARSLS